MAQRAVDVDTDTPEDPNPTPDEVEELYEVDQEIEPVSYWGSDFDVEGLVRRLDRDDIAIPTFGHQNPTIEAAGFQRSFVWRRPQMDRFIESLLLGYPIPGIMLVQQEDKRYLVLDGQQRLRTLSAFYQGLHQGKEFALQNVAEQFKGLTYRTLEPELRRQIDNTFIQATIVKTDGSRESLEAIYQVFERLNSGGTQLMPHEIRVALYPGKFVDFLSELNSDTNWRQLYGPPSPRLRDQELILRLVALYISSTNYSRPLKKFLNEFVGRHRNLEGLNKAELLRLFAASTRLLFEAAGRGAIRYQSTQVNTALTEALFVGLMRRIKRSGSRGLTGAKVARALDRLAANEKLASAISGGTATEEYLRNRLSEATAEFAKIG